MKHKTSVKLKLTIAFVLLFLAMTGIFTWYLVSISNSVYKRTQSADLKELLSKDITFIEGYKNGHLALSEGFLYEYSGIFVSVYNDKKGLLAGQIPLAMKESPEFINGEIRNIETENSSLLVLDLYYPFDWEQGVWIRGVVEMNDQTRIMKSLIIASGLSLPIFLVIVVILSLIISKGVLLPLDRINNTAKSINEIDDLSQRIALKQGSREFIELSNAMDGMLERLESSYEKEKRFTSDASHELRTPISVIKGAAEYSLKYDENDEWQDSMKMILKNANNMADMVESLLSLSRLERATEGIKFERFNLSDLTEAICEDFDLDINISIEPNIFINGEKSLIIRMINNLLDNSKKYSDSNISIWVSLQKEIDSPDAILSIKDNGFGIPADKLEMIFDRFYRVDESRNNTIPGTGLGLSLVSEIAKIHDAKIEVDSIPNIGTEFKIHFILVS